MYICIYIYKERETERERERITNMYIYIYIYIYVCVRSGYSLSETETTVARIQYGHASDRSDFAGDNTHDSNNHCCNSYTHLKKSD